MSAKAKGKNISDGKGKKSKSNAVDAPAQAVPLNFAMLIKSIWIYPVAAIFVLVILFSLRLAGNYDLGFHLAAGRWIVENFSVPHTDIFTYTVSANEYIDIQWLYQVINYLVQSLVGYGGLTALNMFLVVSIFALLLKRFNAAGVPAYLSAALLLVAIITIQLRISYRPEVFTWFFMVLTISVLDKYFYKKQGNLILIPLITILWVNSHGLFILGIGIIGAYNVSVFIRDRKPDNRLLLWSTAAAVSTLINPYFTKGILFPVTLYTRLQEGNIFRKTITELKPPGELLSTPGLETIIYAFYGMAVIGALLLVITYKKRQVHQLIIFAAFLYISYSSFRNIPIFILYGSYITGLALSDIIYSAGINTITKKFSPFKRYFAAALVLISVLTGARIVTGAYYFKNNSAIKFGAGIDRTMLPEKAAGYLAEKNSGGRIINTLAYGGWLEWKLKQPVFIDGRLEVIGENFYAKYLAALKTGGIVTLTNEYSAQIVFSDPETITWNKDLFASTVNWRMDYLDNNAVIFVKDSTYSKYFNPDTVLRNSGIDKNMFSREAIKKMFSEAHIYGWGDYLKGFYTPQYFAADLKKAGNFAFDLGAYDLSVFFYLETIRLSRGTLSMENYRELFLNLGMLYDMAKEYEFAAICFDKYLESEPGDSAVRNRSAELKKLAK